MEVILSDDAVKGYKRLPVIEQKKILKKLKVLETDLTAGKKLSGELAGIRSLRVWPYRILYEINEKRHRVEVHKIAHRQGAYR